MEFIRFELPIEKSGHHLYDNIAQERNGHIYGSVTCCWAIALPDIVLDDREDKSVRHYLRWIGDRMLRVKARFENGRWFVLTAHDDEGETKRFQRDRPEVIAARPGPDLAGRRRYRKG
jgi:hypothetical protein